MNPFITTHTALLHQRLGTLQRSNKILADETISQYVEIEDLVRHLETFVTEVGDAARTVSGKDNLETKATLHGML